MTETPEPTETDDPGQVAGWPVEEPPAEEQVEGDENEDAPDDDVEGPRYRDVGDEGEQPPESDESGQSVEGADDAEPAP